MQISLLLMEEIAKLFAIMLMGYAVVKAGLMKSSESKSISVVMVYLVIPCVIIDAFQVDYTPDVKKGLLLACAAAVLVHVLFLILTTILKQVLRLDTIERATVIYSNAGILVIPLVQDLLGQEYVIYSSAYIAVQLILIWTHCKNMLCEEDRLEWKKVFLNVNIISIIVGVILFICRIQLPSGMQDVLDMMTFGGRLSCTRYVWQTSIRPYTSGGWRDLPGYAAGLYSPPEPASPEDTAPD